MLVAVSVAALVAAAPAAAKEIVGLQLCGSSGCATARTGLPPAHDGPLMGDGGATVAPSGPARWYRAAALVGDGGKVFGRLPFYFLPERSLMVVPGQGGQTTAWTNATPQWKAALTALTAKVEAFGPPTIERVSLNSKHAADPQSYLDLYTVGKAATTYPKHDASIQVVLETAKRTPWTDGNYVVLYPDDDMLVRDGQLVSIPSSIADAAAAGRSLDAGHSFPWLVVAIAIGFGVLVAAALLVARRTAAGGVRRPVPQA
jgi:hypothetical protein